MTLHTRHVTYGDTYGHKKTLKELLTTFWGRVLTVAYRDRLWVSLSLQFLTMFSRKSISRLNSRLPFLRLNHIWDEAFVVIQFEVWGFRIRDYRSHSFKKLYCFSNENNLFLRIGIVVDRVSLNWIDGFLNPDCNPICNGCGLNWDTPWTQSYETYKIYLLLSSPWGMKFPPKFE